MIDSNEIFFKLIILTVNLNKKLINFENNYIILSTIRYTDNNHIFRNLL